MIRNDYYAYHYEFFFGLHYDARNDTMYLLMGGPSNYTNDDGYYTKSYEIWGHPVDYAKLADMVDAVMTDDDELFDFDYMLDCAVDEYEDKYPLADWEHWDDCDDDNECRDIMRELCGWWWR